MISIINEHKNRYNIDNNHILCYLCIKLLFLYMIVVFIKFSLSQQFIKFNNEKRLVLLIVINTVFTKLYHIYKYFTFVLKKNRYNV